MTEHAPIPAQSPEETAAHSETEALADPGAAVPDANPDPQLDLPANPPFTPDPAPAKPTAEEAAATRKEEKLERQKEDSIFPFAVSVGQVYDGPLDLLLDLIRRQDIDIYDIPIARITAQFLAYVENLKQTDVDSAGEFIYWAALLIHIKSKTLLPRDPSESADPAADDPRMELVERLLEHERFKSAAQMLYQKQQIEDATWTNPAMRDFRDAEGTEAEIAADTVDLVRVFRQILERAKQRPILNVDEESVTVGQMLEFVRRRLLMEDRPVTLRRLLGNVQSERALICMFLALLELVRLQAVLLRQDRSFSDIIIKKGEGFESIPTETRDDWR